MFKWRIGWKFSREEKKGSLHLFVPSGPTLWTLWTAYIKPNCSSMRSWWFCLGVPLGEHKWAAKLCQLLASTLAHFYALVLLICKLAKQTEVTLAKTVKKKLFEVILVFCYTQLSLCTMATIRGQREKYFVKRLKQ